jgi:hypothetical protein
MNAKWLLVLGALVCAGCEETTQSASEPAFPGASTQDAPREPLDLTLVWVAPRGNALVNQIGDELRSEMGLAGFRLAASDAGRTADGKAIATISVTEQPSMVKIVVNGKRRVTYDVRVSIAVYANDVSVDQSSTTFESPNGQLPRGALAGVVRSLAASRPLAQLARKREAAARQAAEAAAEQDRQTQRAAAEKERAEREEAWLNAARPCQAPTSPTACDALQVYLAKYPDSLHAADGREALASAKPTIERLQRDEAEWQKAGAAACGPGAKGDACVGVEVYLEKFGGGIHAAEARRRLGKDKEKP